MANIYRWLNDEDHFLPTSINSSHENKVKIAIGYQNFIGWHQFLRGIHSKFWDADHLQWVIDSRQQNATHQWNIYAILKFINLSISIWAGRCIQIRKLRLSPEHETILIKAKKLLSEI